MSDEQDKLLVPLSSEPIGERVETTATDAGPLLRRNGADTAGAPSAVTLEPSFHDSHLRSLRELLDFAPIGYIVTDSRGIIKEANHTAGEFMKASRAYLLDKPLGLFVISRDTRRFYRLLAELGVDRHVGRRNAEFRVGRSGSADVAYLAAAVEVLPDQVYGDRCYRWLIRDVTARVAAEDGFRNERSFADALLEIVPSYVLVLDRDGLILRANAWAQTNLSDTHLSLVGASLSSFLPHEDRRDANLIMWHSFQGDGVNRLRTRLRKVDGELRAVSWLLKIHAGADGQRAILAVGHDITDLEEAQAQKLRGERLAAVGEFVTMLAHESRNALQRAQACLERLTWRLAEQPEALDLVRRTQIAQTELTRLFEDIRVFTTTVALKTAPCPLREVWREAWRQVIEVREIGASLREPACESDLTCLGDRFRLVQVFRNLYENSLDAGANSVQIDLDRNDTTHFLRILVRDDGHGIAADDCARVFEPFFTTKAHGSGLGMAICRRIIEAHGGKIAIRGTPNARGTEVVLLLRREMP